MTKRKSWRTALSFALRLLARKLDGYSHPKQYLVISASYRVRVADHE